MFYLITHGVPVMFEATPLDNFLTAATSLLSWCLTSMGSIITAIIAQPMLLIGFLITVVSLAFGLVFRTAGQR